jgi:hypothetical protein
MARTVAGTALAFLLVMSLSPLPAWAAGASCIALGQARQAVPQAASRPYQPVNGSGGFSVFGARTLDRGGFSVGLGYLGEDAVCQQLDGVFDLDTVWLALAYGITDGSSSASTSIHLVRGRQGRARRLEPGRPALRPRVPDPRRAPAGRGSRW